MCKGKHFEVPFPCEKSPGCHCPSHGISCPFLWQRLSPFHFGLGEACGPRLRGKYMCPSPGMHSRSCPLSDVTPGLTQSCRGMGIHRTPSPEALGSMSLSSRRSGPGLCKELILVD